MSRMRKSLQRAEPFRDCRLMVVACEGSKTEPDYFERLRLAFRQTRLRIHVVPREHGASSPAAVVQSLLAYQANQGQADDIYWVVFDRDEQSWSLEQIHGAISLCQQNSIGWAISNPFFELWLAMHFAHTPDTITGFQLDHRIKQFVAEQKQSFGGNMNAWFDRLTGSIQSAVDLAIACGCDNNDPIPQRLNTQMFRLARQFLQMV